MRPKLGATHITIIVVAFLGAIVALVVTGKDTGALVAVGSAILAGLGLAIGQQTGVSDKVNGNTTKMLEMLETFGTQLAKMQPPPPPPDDKPAGRFPDA